MNGVDSRNRVRTGYTCTIVHGVYTTVWNRRCMCVVVVVVAAVVVVVVVVVVFVVAADAAAAIILVVLLSLWL